MLNCTHQKEDDTIENDLLLKKHFNSTELRGLSDIIAFTDSIVLSKNTNKNVKKAYKYYLDSIFNRYASRNSIAFSIENKNSLFVKISPDLFAKIWKKKPKSNRKKAKSYNFEIDNSIKFNAFGGYMKYIKELSEQDKKYESINNVINAVGSLGMPTITEILRHRAVFDHDNIHDRLWISIFLLSIDDKKNIKKSNQP